MFQEGLFKGKKILVTGGGTGLGRGMAELLLGLGAEIAICGRRKGVCEATAEDADEGAWRSGESSWRRHPRRGGRRRDGRGDLRRTAR